MTKPKFTLMQRLLRPVINWLVEGWFPKGCFYGRNYLNDFKVLDQGKDVVGKTAAMYLQSIMRKADATSIIYEMTEVTERNVPVGSYKLTLEKID
ncbi:hypothetical protein [Phaeobacter gallaeciensis]|uniref:Uncharacterized protein n=1 Tax=Phaeobacter gallaeciensis TaxID=60890 RepID=A0AAC9Z9N0_9RHOB|nr:hypothetical protein [Phaeobacter gallaeciensis]AHD09983.1 hypothetical protein Gal_02236 [Phaeobacter gallaeciensis DSM 26640]ATE93247.1 hypothetical protein PhaeoP11_02227 [Phaeobacter gallaeciensis]ATE96931.1 hypothetical protein PhaeoP73_01619 [Phaeobacter gallaeciensis]ATF01912.1 hypothetical protein PhaeoP75_02277 [Phaeobacter gallaeciensis]ATF06292.1 hypothetical protein PhaeoP63_02226 [Phaeobacter gallaeciensis]